MSFITRTAKARLANQTSRPFGLRTAHGPGYATENRVSGERDKLRSHTTRAGEADQFPVGRSIRPSIGRRRRCLSHHRSPLPPRRTANYTQPRPAPLPSLPLARTTIAPTTHQRLHHGQHATHTTQLFALCLVRAGIGIAMLRWVVRCDAIFPNWGKISLRASQPAARESPRSPAFPDGFPPARRLAGR